MFSYEEAREFIKEVGKRGSILGLHNMRVLMGELNNVQNTIKTVHIAGTNGKGSLGAYLASICTKAGLTVGRYCSPAVFDPMECWQYSGRNIQRSFHFPWFLSFAGFVLQGKQDRSREQYECVRRGRKPF